MIWLITEAFRTFRGLHRPSEIKQLRPWLRFNKLSFLAILTLVLALSLNYMQFQIFAPRKTLSSLEVNFLLSGYIHYLSKPFCTYQKYPTSLMSYPSILFTKLGFFSTWLVTAFASVHPDLHSLSGPFHLSSSFLSILKNLPLFRHTGEMSSFKLIFKAGKEPVKIWGIVENKEEWERGHIISTNSEMIKSDLRALLRAWKRNRQMKSDTEWNRTYVGFSSMASSLASLSSFHSYGCTCNWLAD